MLIDSHAHLDSPRYADDREAMLRRAWEAGVGAVLAIGIGEEAAGMDGALAVCREFNGGGSGEYAEALRQRGRLSAQHARDRRRGSRQARRPAGRAGGDRLRRDRAGLLPRGRAASRCSARG